jgi:hypothetical protein
MGADDARRHAGVRGTDEVVLSTAVGGAGRNTGATAAQL